MKTDALQVETLSYRNRRGDEVKLAAISATEAKNEFGRVLDTVMRVGAVVVTKHDAPKAVILSLEEFAALTTRAEPDLHGLTAEFDAMLQGMQTPEARAAMKAAFGASPDALAKAALAAARPGA